MDIKSGKSSDEQLANVDLAAVYSSSFDAVLYGSEQVVKRYVGFRTPDSARDAIDTLRAFAGLLIAMREDVTQKKSDLSEEAVLSTFVNFTQDELLAFRLRTHLRESPEARRQLAEMLSTTAGGSSATDKPA